MGVLNMECPYCKKEMIEGYIYGDMNSFEWLPEDKKHIGIFASIRLKFKSKSFWGRKNAKAYRCVDCYKLIIDMNEDK